MDLLNFLRDKKNETRIIVHPYADTNMQFKYLYCFGLGVLSYGHMKAINETGSAYEELLNNIQLHQPYRDNIIVDINNNFDRRINEVLTSLITRDYQYMFIADLLRLSAHTLWAQQFCESIIDIYMSIFKMTKGERDFLLKFHDATRKGNQELANTIYHTFAEGGYFINYKIVKYMSGDFVLKDEFTEISLLNGESMVLDRPVTIMGDILIKNGSSLIIDGGEVKIKGSIQVDGGIFQIKSGSITVISCNKKSLINVENASSLFIENAVIDCNFKCGFINQKKGYMIVKNTKFLHSKNEKGILFAGKMLTIEESSLEDCLSGGIHLAKDTSMNAYECKFFNCESEQGGAIYAESIYNIMIANCSFTNCKAKYIGGAIYFAHKKYGQEVIDCEFIKVIPQDSAVFNEYILINSNL